MIRRPPRSTLFPTRRSSDLNPDAWRWHAYYSSRLLRFLVSRFPRWPPLDPEVGNGALQRINAELLLALDRKSTRLNSSHGYISYAVFCLKKKNTYKSRVRST